MLGLVQNVLVQMVVGNIYEGLLCYDLDFQLMLLLVKSWIVLDDGLIYIFNLEEDVKWYDGVFFLLVDVVFSVDVFLCESYLCFCVIFEYVVLIEVLDDNIVVFIFKLFFGLFLNVFEVGLMLIVFKYIYEGIDFQNNFVNNIFIGIGLFKLDEWVKGFYIKLVKNVDYWDEGKFYFDEVYWYVIFDVVLCVVVFEMGQVDIFSGGLIENFDVLCIIVLDNICVIELGWEFFGVQFWLWLNNCDDLFMVSKELWQVVMYVIDWQFIIDVLWNGMGSVLNGFFVVLIKYCDVFFELYVYDLEKVKELVVVLGYGGEVLDLVLMFYGEFWMWLVEVICQNLFDVGINVNIVVIDVVGWNQCLFEWDFDILFIYLFQYGDLVLGVLCVYVLSNIVKGLFFNNVEGYVNFEVDKLFDQGVGMINQDECIVVYIEVQKVFYEDVLVVWLMDMFFLIIICCNVKDLVIIGIGINDGFKNVYIEK